jgi:hypothetical protein
VDEELPKGADEYVEAADEGAEPPGPGVNEDLAPGPTGEASEEAGPEDAEAAAEPEADGDEE